MVASRRERVIGLVTAGVLALLALDRLVLTPLTDRREQLAAELVAAEAERQRADQVILNGKRANKRWDTMLAGGLKDGVPEAESQALHALGDWANDAGITLTSLKPQRVERREQFDIVTVRATANGSLRSIGQFLWRLQTADIPMRITDMQVSSRKEGTDDLSLQLGVSTLALAPEAPTAPGGGARAGQSVASAAGDRSGVAR